MNLARPRSSKNLVRHDVAWSAVANSSMCFSLPPMFLNRLRGYLGSKTNGYSIAMFGTTNLTASSTLTFVFGSSFVYLFSESFCSVSCLSPKCLHKTDQKCLIIGPKPFLLVNFCLLVFRFAYDYIFVSDRAPTTNAHLYKHMCFAKGLHMSRFANSSNLHPTFDCSWFLLCFQHRYHKYPKLVACAALILVLL